MTAPRAGRVLLRALGVRFEVRLLGLTEAEQRRVVRAWEWCAARAVLDGEAVPEPEVIITAGVGHTGVDLVAGSLVELADRLTATITVAALERRRHDLLMLHAAAVADPDTGAVVTLIGPSGRGKTTACQALGHHFGYVTDEATAVTDRLTVVPYPKPLSVKSAETAPYKRQDNPGDAGVRPAPRRLFLAGVLLLDRVDLPAGAPATLEEVSFADAVTEVVTQVSFLRDRPHPLHRLAGVLEAGGGLHRVTYGSADTLVPVVRGLLDDAVREGRTPPGPWVAPASLPAVAGAPGPGQLGHGEVLDALELDDGGLAVLTADAHVRVLSGIAPAVFAATRRPATSAAVVAEVLAVHGEPPDGSGPELVAAAVDQLVAVGVLSRG